MILTEEKSPLAVYIHWPFCLSKCPYCDFNSHVREAVDENIWCTALLNEIDHFAQKLPRHSVASVFFGGGTPSLMSPRTVSAIINCLADAWGLQQEAEITLEANPSSVERGRFVGYRCAGVNRLSIGVQALNDRDLTMLGRHHSVAEAKSAVATAQALFSRSSFDLIYARPNQTSADWCAEISDAVAIADGHLSAYQLTIEKGTVYAQAFKRGALAPPKDDHTATLYEITQNVLGRAGLEAYEISNHARPGNECRHNLTYWLSGEYVGIGPGAHGRYQLRNFHAVQQIRSPERWLAAVKKRGHGTEAEEILKPETRVREVIMMGLRLVEGITGSQFHKATGQFLEEILDIQSINKFSAVKLIKWDGYSLRLTPTGRPLLNSILSELL